MIHRMRRIPRQRNTVYGRVDDDADALHHVAARGARTDVAAAH